MPPEERVASSVGLSLLLIYLSSFLIFLLRLPAAVHGSILLVCAGMTFAVWRDLGRLLKDREVRRLLLGFGVLAIWALALLSLIRNYSGDNWYGDWLEHYQRSLFFLDRPDAGILFQGGYAVPARPPLMNVLCGHFMGVAGRNYAVYQLISTLMSLLIYFPASLLAKHFSRNRRANLCVLVTFLMFNPMVVQNVTYSWTKLLAAFYVLAGVYFYLRGWHENKHSWTLMAFTSLSAGIVTHYSAGPYTLFLAIHYLLVVFPSRKARWAELSAIGLVALFVLGTWFGYSISSYGRGTVTSTTSYFEAAEFTAGQNVAKIAANIGDSVVPHLIRGVGVQGFGPGLFWGPIRDAAFKLYQFNLLFGLGSLGSILLVFGLLSMRKESRRERSPERAFWPLFAFFCLVVGIAVQGERYDLGLTHITLQPLVLIGITFLAGRFCDWPIGVRWLAWSGLVIDLLFGIALHFGFQCLTFGAHRAIPGRWGITSRDLLVGSVWANWELKQKQGLIYLGDFLLPYAWAVESLAFGVSVAALAFLARQASNRLAAVDGSGQAAWKAEPQSPGVRKIRSRKRSRRT